MAKKQSTPSYQDKVNMKAKIGASKISAKESQKMAFMKENEANKPKENEPMRMTKSGKMESDVVPAKGENPLKRKAREEAREQGSKNYTFNGKQEFAGMPKPMKTIAGRGIETTKTTPMMASISVSKKTPAIAQQKPKPAPVKTVVKVGKSKIERPTVFVERAQGLGGKNKLQGVPKKR